ncbi:esterase-like activity of phytase family protein [Nonomuraea sp. NPDC046802]|uniref:esterase-like activity of phytase family protein n=1 Tax=Nonomuraea sp. NPDC046802 TaxID=3154919 RepID=UPI0033D26826
MARSRRTTIKIATALAVLSAGLTVPTAAEASDPVRLTRFIGEQRLPHLMRFKGTVVGGLSGIDRDPRTGAWVFVSDDRRRYAPARFYTGTLDIDLDKATFDGVRLTGVTTMTRADGTPYPGYGQPHSADPETIRFDPWSKGLLWGDEGDRPDATHPDIPVSSSAVRIMGADGRVLSELPVPSNLELTSADVGPRRNQGFEGLAVAERTIAAVTEGPRYEDGPLPTLERGAPARLTTWSRTGRLRGQYVYPLDALPAAPKPPTGLAETGVSELLAVDDFRYLALERAWVEGVGYRVKLYEVDLRGATNVLNRPSLGSTYRAVRKRLVHVFGTPTQNLEGLAWGPRLDNGECTLVVGSDDNFAADEVTQFLAFAATGCNL